MQHSDSTDNFVNPSSQGYPAQDEEPKGASNVSQSNRIGDCHIFNFESYDSTMTLNKRDGSQKDLTELKKVFSALKFNVKGYENYSKYDTLEAVKNGANSISPDKYFVCCIMTHGDDKDRVAARDNWLHLEDIFDECSNIMGKNKTIFIVQACRSDDINLEKLVIKESTEFGSDKTIYSDVLVARSTYPDTVSMRTDEGTYFIQEVCHALTYLHGNLNLYEVLTVVNFKMANFFKTNIGGKKGGQMPIFYSTLTSEIEFHTPRNGSTESYGESLVDKRIAMRKEKPFDVNYLSSLKYDITPENINFFSINIKLGNVPELSQASASLSRVLRNPNSPCLKPYNISTRKAVKESIKDSIKKSAKQKPGCVFFLISGPSSYGSLCDPEGRKIYERDVIEYFVNNQIPDLISKPKIFLFLMFERVSESSLPVESKETGDSCDGGKCERYIAQHADILEINIAVKSVRNSDITEKVDAIIEQIKASSDSQDFLSILTKVNSTLVQKKFLDNENTFQFNSTLTKKLILPKRNQS